MHCTNDAEVKKYRETLRNNIFLMMELSGSSYSDIRRMPVDDMRKYIDWKINFDKEREKARMEAINKR